MKKLSLITLLLIGVAVIALAIANPTLAAEASRGGPGGGGARGGRQGTSGIGTGVPLEQTIYLDGALSELIHENLASALGISLEELVARLDAGETVSQIMLDLGLDPTLARDLVLQARTDALTQAVTEGLITQEQADWLATRWTASPGNPDAGFGAGIGICDGTGDCLLDGSAAMSKMMQNKGFRKGFSQ